jgi:hypothetical protein
MRALAVLITLLLMTIPTLAASLQVQAAVKAIQTVGTDAQRLKTYCELVNRGRKCRKGAPFCSSQNG